MKFPNSLKTKMLFISMGILSACGGSSPGDGTKTETKTPVTVTHVSQESMSEIIELNATSMFQVKDNVKAPLTGYIQTVHVKLGDYVKKGQLLFTVKTKDAAALENKTDDSALYFSGLVKVYSTLGGFVTSLSKQNGDYIQDGDDLAIVAQQSSLVFLLEVPFELKKYVKIGSYCNIILPGGDIIKSYISSAMPTVDEISQTQNFVLRPYSKSVLPENLIATVEIVKSVKESTQTLPKDALLTNETQSEWWIMKLINDSTAVKTPVIKGIESGNKIEILEPIIENADRIILTGNYGLSDTAKVIINK